MIQTFFSNIQYRPQESFLRILQSSFCFQGSHTSRTCWRNCLTIFFVLDITSCKDSGNRCLCCSWLSHDITSIIKLYLSFQKSCIRRMSNSEKKPSNLYISHHCRLMIDNTQSRNFFPISKDFLNLSMSEEFNFWIFKCLLLHRFRGSQFVCTNKHKNFGPKMRHMNCFFHSNITSSYNGNNFVTKHR